MTAFALAAKLAIVLVILLVAGNALGFQFLLVNRPPCRQVAVVALRLQVLVPEPILGITVMIKGNRFPRFLGMASLAFVAIVFFVTPLLIILLVAGNALGFQLLLVNRSLCRQVAFVTFRFQVFIPELILGIPAMIKGACLPFLLGMTSLAFAAIAPFVALLLIIFLVARVADRLQLIFVQISLVATGALCRRTMLPE